MLALPSAERPKPRNLLNLGAILGGVGSLMAVGAFTAAWVNVSHFTRPWPPKGVTISNYDGTLLVLTMLMSAATVEWGIWAIRREQQNQAVAGFALSAGLGVAFLNLLWYTGRKLGFGPAASPYSVLLFAMFATVGVAVAVGIGLLLAALARVLGQQFRPNDLEAARAVGWFWQFLVLAWIVVYATVWLFS
jgi:heme/copper-type cytochrome/quinol oxidase subunit 3